MGSLEGYGLPGTPPPEADPGESYVAVSPPSPEDEAVDFITYCVAVASGSPHSEADPHTHKAIELTAKALWPDVVGVQHMCFDAEAREVIVEVGDTAYRIRVREVPIATAHDPVDGGLGTRQQPSARWQH